MEWPTPSAGKWAYSYYGDPLSSSSCRSPGWVSTLYSEPMSLAEIWRFSSGLRCQAKQSYCFWNPSKCFFTRLHWIWWEFPGWISTAWCGAALITNAQSWPCQVPEDSEMFSESKLKIPKKPNIIAYFRLGQLKCFKWFTCFSFRNLSYSKLNYFFRPFSRCLKRHFKIRKRGRNFSGTGRLLKLMLSREQF